MGEVGAVLPEKQPETPATTVNGDVNGVCKLTAVTCASNETMDVDTEEDSQISSENGISEASENHNSLPKLPIIAKAESLSSSAALSIVNHNKLSKASSIHSDENSQHNLAEAEDEMSRDQQSINDGEIEADNSQGDENTRTSATTNDENSQDGIDDDPKEDISSRENEVNMTTEGEETTNDNSMQHDPLDEENSQSSHNSAKSGGYKENGIKITQVKSLSNVVENENDGSQSASNDQAFEKHKGKENGEMNGSRVGGNDTDDITIIESDEDENDGEPARPSPPLATNTNQVISCAKEQPPVEQMEIDSTTQNTSKGNENSSLNKNAVDDDAPVIIPSDSESEDDTSKKTETPAVENKRQSTDEDMSGDDCVVIEDDDKKEKDANLEDRNAKRNNVRPRNTEDDDVTEVLDDLPPSKKPRTTPMITPAATPNIQVGQITLKDPRSLMPQQFNDQALKSTFQQQFAQSVGMVPTTVGKVAPGTLPMPVTSPQGIFPNNIRPALAPLSVPPKLVPTTPVVSPSPTLLSSNPTLLPALTDDMFVLEAPSFIVPYIYEKPPSTNLKDIVIKLEAEISKLREQIKGSSSEVKKDEAAEDSKESKAEAETEVEGETKNDEEKSKKKKKSKNPDDSWDELDTSTDEEASDSELQTKVLIKDSKTDLNTIKAVLTPEAPKPSPVVTTDDKKNDPKNENYFEGPLGKFFIDIGINLVQEYVQTDLLKLQKRKLSKSMKSATAETELAIRNLQKNIEASKKRNEPFKFEMKRCEYCNFKSESALAMAHHYETPHMRQYLYKCNLCPYETRPAHDILFHMEAVHNVKGRLEKALAYNQCPNCPFEENGKAKFARHIPVCAKKFRPEVNLQPPHDWEAPAKIPRIKPRHGLVGTATAYQAMAAQAAAQKAQLAAMAARASAPAVTPPARNRGGRPAIVPRMPSNPAVQIRGSPPIRPQIPGVVLPTGYQIAPGGQIIQVAGSNLAVLPNPHNTLSLQQPHQSQAPQNLKKNAGQQPSISITPLPRQPANISNAIGLSAAAAMPPKPPAAAAGMKPGQAPSGAGGKASFVICEICDGYIKDLEQLRNHMQWMHKVKIHPKMIHNRPPLNCQKCQFRFFTDQGLERHLLGSHGLVTSSMQEAANKGKDAGRCPVCGRMYQWKLLNHVSRDHHMTLKPAHLSYKCTVCTATFGMYKQFENHVYTAHSTVAKKAMDGKKNSGSGSNNNSPMASGGSSSNMGGISVSSIVGQSKSGGSTSLTAISSGDSLLKPLKINDEITIIPQPASKLRGSLPNDFESHMLGKSSGKR